MVNSREVRNFSASAEPGNTIPTFLNQSTADSRIPFQRPATTSLGKVFSLLLRNNKRFYSEAPSKEYRFESFGLSPHHHALLIHYGSMNISIQQT